MRIEELLDGILETVEKGFNLKLFNRRILDGDKIVSIVENIREVLPEDFREAEKITANRNRIIKSAEEFAENKKNAATKEADAIVADAKAKADAIIKEAQATAEEIIRNANLKAEYLINENTITKEANARATQLLTETNNDCKMIMDATQADCNKMRDEAQQWSNDIRKAAYEYAVNMVNEIDSFLSSSTSDLHATKNNLENME